MAREYLCAYHSTLEASEPLNDAELGRLFRALLIYSRTGEIVELRGNERFLFPALKAQIDRDNLKYEQLSQKQSENGKLGGRPKKANESQKTQSFLEKPKKANTKEKEKAKAKDKEKEKTNIDALSVFDDFSNGNVNLQKALTSFADMRKTIKKPLTLDAAKLLIGSLDKLCSVRKPNDKAGYMTACLNASVFNNWQGVFAVEDFKDTAIIAEPIKPDVQREFTDDMTVEDIF